MKRRWKNLCGIPLIIGVLLALSVMMVRGAPLEFPLAEPSDLTPTDYIIVTSSLDDGGLSERCDSHSPCTLRRAINQVRWYSASDRVFQIAFDLQITDPAYDASEDVWVIDVDSDNSGLETAAFREFGNYGRVIIDGSTQPRGRDLVLGPRIFLRGDNEKGAFNLTGGQNVVRHLGFQGFGNQMVLIPATDDNLVEDNWFGLTLDGSDIYLRNPDYDEDGSGESGIFSQGSGDEGAGNTIQNNLLLGFHASAINVQGDHNYVLSNTVGTRSDGSVPQIRAERKCKPNARYYNWFAGAGIDIFGTDNLVADNRLVGMLFQSNDPLTTPDDAISVTGHDHIVRDNIIGLTADGEAFGVCGEGIHVGGVSGGHFVQVVDNLVVGAQGSGGIFVTATEMGYDLDAVSVKRNVILQSALEAFAFGDKVPAALRLFAPAAVTSINGVNVTGSSGVDSLCENCAVEIFLDRVDTFSETLESLGTVSADGSGNWSFTLARTLALTEGLRTASTTVVDGQIQNGSGTIVYSAGTTTRISEIYTQTGAPEPQEPEALTPEEPLPVVDVVYPDVPVAPSTFNTTLTVDSAEDPDARADYTCYRDLFGPPVPAPDGKCTLRRAIVEATALAAEDPAALPIEIRFDLRTNDPGYDAGLDVWVIEISDDAEGNALPTLGSTDVEKSGYVVINGDSQPIGRSDGPRVIIRGPAGHELDGYGLVVNGNHNVIRDLAFQDLRMMLQLNHSENIVEDCWFGLTSDGNEIYLRNVEAPEDGSGQGGIKVAANTRNTLIKNNVLAGLHGAAIDVEGNESFISGNSVGTRADGTVPQISHNRWCKPNARYYNWFGGAGIEIGGKLNRVLSNRIAGLLWYSADPLNTPDTALEVSGQDHIVWKNVVGVGSDDVEVGSCGRGIVVDARYTRVEENTVVRTLMEPFRMAGSEKSMNALAFEKNLSWDSAPVYMEFGNYVPEARAIFTPAQVLTITLNGGQTFFNGSAHPDAPCPFCQIELFLDDLDGVTETLESLDVVTADVNGDWIAVWHDALGLDEGVRTTSTAINYDIMPQFDGPSTSRVSEVYSRAGATPPAEPPALAPVAPRTIPETQYRDPPLPVGTYATVISVTTSSDSSTSQTCADTTPENCSLRRAINQVKLLPEGERPVLIAFDLLESDLGYDADGYWVITLTTDLPAVKGGSVTLDGATQPLGRAEGPRVLLRRATSTGAKLRLGETQQEGAYVLSGLAFQGVEIHMSGSDNIVAHNWLGHKADGSVIYLYNGSPAMQNHAIIVGASDSDHNHVHHNALAGSSTNAIKLQGVDSLIENNVIGTLPDGTLPVGAVAPEDVCDHTQVSGNWYGGGGIVLYGKRHRVLSNTLAGLMLYGSANQTQPPAIEVFGMDHKIRDNRIGVDAEMTLAWNCGPAIDNNDASFVDIRDNFIANAFEQGIFVDGTIIAINATTMRGNVITNTLPSIGFGQSVPVTLSLFNPAMVTKIDDVQVNGISDDACPYCDIDIFLDDDDALSEALVYVGTTSADQNGDWSYTLPVALPEGMGLRTISTSRTYGVIENFEAGTSSGLSALFTEQPPAAPQSVIVTPVTAWLSSGSPLVFEAKVTPITATLPLTYTWEATGYAPQSVRGGVENDITYQWDSVGVKHITVTVVNDYGSTQGLLSVEVVGGQRLYLPQIVRNK